MRLEHLFASAAADADGDTVASALSKAVASAPSALDLLATRRDAARALAKTAHEDARAKAVAAGTGLLSARPKDKALDGGEMALSGQAAAGGDGTAHHL